MMLRQLLNTGFTCLKSWEHSGLIEFGLTNLMTITSYHIWSKVSRTLFLKTLRKSNSWYF